MECTNDYTGKYDEDVNVFRQGNRSLWLSSYVDREANNLQAEYPYPAALDVVEFLLKTLFDTGCFFKRDENESPPLLRFVVSGKLSGFNLKEKCKVRLYCSLISITNNTAGKSNFGFPPPP